MNPANPKSKPGNKGLNENYGREVMELHTVGVNGGYTAGRCDEPVSGDIVTGWTVNQPGQAGGFQFDAKRHEPGTKVWMGQRIGSGPVFVVQGGSATAAVQAAKAPHLRWRKTPSMAGMMGGGMNGADAVPNRRRLAMASAPGNAGMHGGSGGSECAGAFCGDGALSSAGRWRLEDLSRTIRQEALVGRMAATFLASDGDIKAVLRAMAASPEFNSTKYFHNKVKTPMEFVAAAYRATLTDPANPGALVNTMRTMGMPLYNALPPTGYYITADKWMNTGALVDRLNFAVQLTGGKFAGQRFDATKIVALGLMSESAEEIAQNRGASSSSDPQSGMELALRILERTLVGENVPAKTNALIHPANG